MGQKSRELREKRENIIHLKVGEVTNGARLESLHTVFADSISTPPHPTLKSAFDGMLGKAQMRRDDDFSLKQKGGQITLARSYPKKSEILPPIRSGRVTASYYVTVGYKRGDSPPPSQPFTIIQSTSLRVRG